MATNPLLNSYKKLIKKLLPQGRAWDSIKEDAVNLFEGIAGEFCRVDERAQELLKEFDPGTSTELLTDWEELLGLPDECTPLGLTVGERQSIARSKLSFETGLSAAYYEKVALDLGFVATVTDYRSFRVGRSRVGEALTNPFDPDKDVFRVGRNRVGDQLVIHGWRYCFNMEVETAGFGDELLECTIKKLKPAHTCVYFTETP